MPRSLVVALTAAALVLAAPTVASAATAVPSLPSGADQAFLADGDGNPIHSTSTLSGSFNKTYGSGLVLTCSGTATITTKDDGTSSTTAFNATTGTCSTNVPTCIAHIAGSNLDWGSIQAFISSVYRWYTNVDYSVQLTSGCPVVGTFSETGTLSPTIAVASGVLTETYSGASSGTVTGPLGSSSLSGTLTSTSGVPSDAQLIH